MTHVHAKVIRVGFLYCMLFLYAMRFRAQADFGPWMSAHATFNGDESETGTMGDACGYGNVYSQGYGTATTALSTSLFNQGMSCGACYEVKCWNDPDWCTPRDVSVVVTATNLCPPNYSLSARNGGWCNPPLQHFDMGKPAFLQIAKYESGIVSVHYRRVDCKKVGGIRFTINGQRNFYMVLVTNVGGAGDVSAVWVKGSRTGWLEMVRNGGQNWQTTTNLEGQSLSFTVQASDGKSVISYDAAPSDWQFGRTYEGNQF